MGLTIKKMDEIHKAVYDGSIDFDRLNVEEQSFALGIVISSDKHLKRGLEMGKLYQQIR